MPCALVCTFESFVCTSSLFVRTSSTNVMTSFATVANHRSIDPPEARVDVATERARYENSLTFDETFMLSSDMLPLRSAKNA